MTRYVKTTAIRTAVKGRETDVLATLGIAWRQGRPHIPCPYPAHADSDPSWRWDDRKGRAFCSCIGTSHSIFDVVMAVRVCDFETAKIDIAEIIGRRDLILVKDEAVRHQPMDAASLLSPPAENRDDDLVRTYLAHRLGVEVQAVPTPSSPIAGLRALPYFDAQKQGAKAKPKMVGTYSCAVFGTIAADGRRHAHRIYVAPGGQGKAELGHTAEGLRRNPKKAARILEGASSAGCSVLWGDPATAPWIILTEGIETGAAVALAFTEELHHGAVAIAAAISATGMEAFTPFPSTKRVTVAADRDEAPKPNSGPPSRRGEAAARAFGLRNHDRVQVGIALPGATGETVDWLDELRRTDVARVRGGVLAAAQYRPTAAEIEGQRTRRGLDERLKEIEATYPIPNLDPIKLRYAVTPAGKIRLHKVLLPDDREETGDRRPRLVPVLSPFGIVARLRQVGAAETYGLRVLVEGMDGTPRAIDLDRADLARAGGQDVRARFMEAGLRTQDDGELLVVAALKAADPENEIIVLKRPGWHQVDGVDTPVFAAPSGEIIGASTDVSLELAATARLARPAQGDMTGWSAAIEAACGAENCPHWVLGVLAGFAGPIIALTGLDTCGINLSGLSSGGKTLAQRLAVSAWSSPDLGAGLLNSMRTTENAIEPLAQMSDGTVLALDEAGHVEGGALARLIYSIASGVGKARARRDGGLDDRAAWSTFAILSGETSLEQKVTSDGGTWMAGMAVRIVDVDVDGTNRGVDSTVIMQISGIRENFGHAGPAFLKRLVEAGYHKQPEDLRTAVHVAAGRIVGDTTDSAQVRAATPLALLSVAGTLAKQFKVIADTVPVGHAISWAWQQFMASSDGRALTPKARALGNLRRWIAERWDVTIKPILPRDDSGVRTNSREAVGWYDGDAIYLPVDRAREAVAGAITDQRLGRMLAEEQVLLQRHDERRAAMRSIPGIGKIDSYWLKRELLVATRPRMTVVDGGKAGE